MVRNDTKVKKDITRFAKRAGWLVIIIGSPVIIGRLINISVLKGISPFLLSTKTNAAFVFLLCGAALLVIKNNLRKR